MPESTAPLAEPGTLEGDRAAKEEAARQRAIALAERLKELRYRKIALYEPHPKQKTFHDIGKEKRERFFFAGNQQGKTLAGAFELACHLTGLYPDWWNGYRFERATRWWVGAVDGTKLRDNPQLKLMGPRSAWGTGMIPRDCIASEPAMGKGVSGLIDFVEIQHTSRVRSTLKFKSYEEEDMAWESDTLHGVWFDEEPPMPKYLAALARLTTTGGILWITATPMLGISEVVRFFYPQPTTMDRGFVRGGIADALHIPAEERARIASRYPAWQRQARVEGFPMLGAGQVYETSEDQIACDAVPIPAHWRRLAGLDLGGGDHPTAIAWGAYDPDTDVLYVTDVYKNVDPKIATHAAALRLYGKPPGWIPTAYPRDAGQQDRSAGDTFADLYRKHGAVMLPTHAQFPDGSVSLEAGIGLIQDRLATGRLRVFKHCSQWFEEYRLYHRKPMDDGRSQIVKLYDDLMDATRYLVMMVRYARRAPDQRRHSLETAGMDYDPLRG